MFFRILPQKVGQCRFIGMKKVKIKHFLKIAIAFFAFLTVVLRQITVSPAETQENKPLTGSLPDISGLAWIENDTFIAVHDAKNPKNSDRPRVSLMWLSKSSEGILWQPVSLNWPEPLGLGSDLESIARIPNSQYFLLAESGDKKQFFRIFLTEYRQHQLAIKSFIEWPISVENVEGTAVARIGKNLIFLYAERADSQSSTKIRWATLTLQPLKIGSFQEVTVINPELSQSNVRPVSAMEVDSEGRLYIASAFDPNIDNGPFRSSIWQIGEIKLAENSKPQVILSEKPQHLATLDGFKVEGITVREKANGQGEIFIGTDDENYGGVLRPLP
ncbi:MAG: hypothetical protein ACRDEA_10380 [Microcystaceae cyanobacterium]